MSNFDFPDRPSLFSRTLRECRELYRGAARRIVNENPELVPAGTDYVELMDDLHRGLVLKIYLTVVEADREWSKQERFFGEVLCHHLWGTWLEKDALRDTIRRASSESSKLQWYSLIKQFDVLEPLRGRIVELETVINRLANLIARCDGSLNEHERAALQSIELEIQAHLRQLPLEDYDPEPTDRDQAAKSIEQARQEANEIYIAKETKPKRKQPSNKIDAKRQRANKPLPAAKTSDKGEEPPMTVEEALAKLDGLIGLDSIKQEVRSLTNFLKLQQRREEIGLPETDISLHMVFTGNPGTGKTTVARIVGKIFGALGVLEKGHLIETDRSGLVAEYAGQTGPKTNAKIDEALDGILFIDEAYSLVARESEDPYGNEAIQALLKRAEDDRERMVVILAGYPVEMESLLRSNPGLSSRFSRRMDFVDYTPLELSQIFGLMCRKNHYELTPATRLKVMLGMRWLFDSRDRHFGNGRASRNLFEHAVRRMANRLADQADVTNEQLMTLEAADIEFQTAPAAIFESLDESQIQLHLSCPDCQHTKDVPTEFLGKKVVCPKCESQFPADWGDLIPLEVNAEN